MNKPLLKIPFSQSENFDPLKLFKKQQQQQKLSTATDFCLYCNNSVVCIIREFL